MRTHQMEDIWQHQFPRWSQQCFVMLTKRNNQLMVQDMGIQLNQCWRERLHMKEHKISAIKIGYAWYSWGQHQEKARILQTWRMGTYVLSELFRNTLVVFQQVQSWRNTHVLHTIGRSTFTTKEVRGFFSLFWSGVFPGEKEKDKTRQAVFLTNWILLERTRKRRSLISITQFLKKFHMKLGGNATKMLYIGYDWRKRRIKVCNSGKRNHLQSWPTSQYQETALTVWLLKTEIEYFSKGLRHQGPHPRSRWRGIGKASSSSVSSSRSSPFLTQTYQVSGNRGRWESKAEVQDDSKHITEADRVPGNRMQSTSGTDVDTPLSDKEVSTDAFSKNEVVKEELTVTNTKAIERIKIGSKTICIREDLAKEKMVFSQESCQAIFEMGNVELIELKTSMLQCPSCSHHVFKRDTSLPMLEAHGTRPGHDATNQSCFWNPESTTLPYVCDYCKGLQTWPTGSPGWSMSGQMLGWDTQTILQRWTSPIQRRTHKGKDTTTLRSVNEDKQAPPQPQRPGYQDAKKALDEMQRQARQEFGIPFTPKAERQSLHHQFDPSIQRYLEWLRTNWAGYFEEERPQPTSSSSWTPSSSWWTSSSWTSHRHQHGWKDSTWSEKW